MNLFKNPWLYVVLALVAAAIIFYQLWRGEHNKAVQQKAENNAKTTLQHPQAKPFKAFVDSKGNAHVEYAAGNNQVPQATLSDTAVTNHTLLDSLAKQLKIKDSQILELTKANLQFKAENIQLKAAGNNLYTYTDPHLSLNYNTFTNQAELNYHVNITTGKFTPGDWGLFSSHAPVLDFSTDDPRALINNVDHVSITLPQPQFGFSVDVKGAYLWDTQKIIPSAGANLRYGRWHLEGRFYYDNTLKKEVNMSYDVLKF
jgi:hypothetical protein